MVTFTGWPTTEIKGGEDMDGKTLTLIMAICLVLKEQVITPAVVEAKYSEAAKKVDEYLQSQGRLPMD